MLVAPADQNHRLSLASLINDPASDFSEEACEAFTSAIGTDYEQTVFKIVCGSSEDIAVAFAQLAPDYDADTRAKLYNYFSDLGFFRYYPKLDHDSKVVEQFASSACEYREAADTQTLPCATSSQVLLINFVSRYPHLTEALLARIETTDDVDEEMLDHLAGNPTPALVDGVL